MSDKPVIEWVGLYQEKYGTLITTESTSHPAKMARGLVFKIYEYALERGYIKKGNWILDPFFGAGCTALPALMHGINVWGNELEPLFTDCARGCECTGISKAEWVRFFERWRRAAYKDRHFCPQCISQAERPVKSTELSLSQASKKRRARIAELEASLRDKGKPRRATLVNPIPYPEKFNHVARQADMFGFVLEASYERNSYTIPHTTAHHYTGNLENWQKYAKNGAVSICTMGDSCQLTSIIREQVGGVVSSPPFNDSLAHKTNASDTTNLGIAADGSKRGGSFVKGNYGDSPSQLGNMPDGQFDSVVGSPPYVDSIHQGQGGTGDTANPDKRKNWTQNKGYGQESGQLGSLTEGSLDSIISSSPFADSIGSDAPDRRGGLYRDERRRNDKNLTGTYGDSEGQLGRLTDEGFDASIGSPPYADSLKPETPEQTEAKQKRIAKSKTLYDGRKLESSSPGKAALGGGYGITDGNLGAMPEGQMDASISSPSFAGNSGGRGDASRNGIDPALFDRSSGGMKRGTGDSEDNLDHLPMTGFDSAVSSPAYGEGEKGHPSLGSVNQDNWGNEGTNIAGRRGKNGRYGQSENQIANENPVTFWAASKEILLQCYLLLKPGAYSFWVVKMYVKNSKLVDFPGQWLKLCEVCGFEHVETIIAWQTEDKGTNYDLDGGKQKKVVRRQSFFRLLHIKNHPELAIDSEIVLVMRKHPHR